MKTLILNGSPRPHGDTAGLLERLLPQLSGEVRVVDAYRLQASPCIDCRFCWDHIGCALPDEMQKLYPYIEVCDNILIASPIYFSELTGKLLDLGSRLQTYYCRRYFQKAPWGIAPKKGAVILVGGGDGSHDRAFDSARILLHHMNCHDIHPLVCSHRTNTLPAVEDDVCLKGLASITEFFNGSAPG